MPSTIAIHEIDDLVHGRVRLAAMAFIAGAGEADFSSIKKAVDSTDGNVSVHLRKLEDAGYLAVRKLFNDRRPQTVYSLTEAGRLAWLAYLDRLGALIDSHRQSESD